MPEVKVLEWRGEEEQYNDLIIWIYRSINMNDGVLEWKQCKDQPQYISLIIK